MAIARRPAKNKEICWKCAGEGHDPKLCKLPDFCIHCKTNEHSTNYKECPRRKREQEIVNIQHRDGVSFLRAKQTYNDDSNVVIHTRSKQQNYETHFELTVEKEVKRKLTPWALEKAIELHLGNKAKSIHSRNETTFLVEVDNKKDQTEKIMKLERVLDYECKVTPANNIYHPQGIAFVYEQNIESNESFEKFQKEFIKYHKVLNVVKASWIKPREGQNSTAILITFSGELPDYMDIPKEKTRIRISESIRKPMLCLKCQQFGHPIKHCKSEFHICGKCGEKHETSTCNKDPPTCCNCKEQHVTKDRKCIYYKYHQEILVIQTRKRYTRKQAELIFNRQNPNFFGPSYAGVLAAQAPNQESRNENTDIDRGKKPNFTNFKKSWQKSDDQLNPSSSKSEKHDESQMQTKNQYLPLAFDDSTDDEPENINKIAKAVNEAMEAIEEEKNNERTRPDKDLDRKNKKREKSSSESSSPSRDRERSTSHSKKKTKNSSPQKNTKTNNNSKKSKTQHDLDNSSQEKQNPHSHKDNKSSSVNNSKSSNKSKIPKMESNNKHKKSPNNNQTTNPVENQDHKEKDNSSTNMEYTINEQKTS